MPEAGLNITMVDRVNEPTPEQHWKAFQAICVVADYDRRIVAELASKLGLDLQAIKKYLNDTRTISAA